MYVYTLLKIKVLYGNAEVASIQNVCMLDTFCQLRQSLSFL